MKEALLDSVDDMDKIIGFCKATEKYCEELDYLKYAFTNEAISNCSNDIRVKAIHLIEEAVNECKSVLQEVIYEEDDKEEAKA